MHAIEAATLESDKLAGQEDVSKCLPGWIRTICDAFEKGDGYTLSHSAVSALAHTLICARVRAERLVRERDESRTDIKRIRDLECRLQHADSLLKRAYDGMHKEHWQEGESESEVCEGIRLYRDNYGAWIE